MRRAWCAVLLTIAAAPWATADTARVDALLERANSAFARGVDAPGSDSPALREAVAAYSAVLDEGFDGARLRLNLGAAHAQMGDTGRAALHLREAARLARERSNGQDFRAAGAALRAIRPGAGEAWPPWTATANERRALRVLDTLGVGALWAVFAASWGVGWGLATIRVTGVGPRVPAMAIVIALLVGACSGAILGVGAWAERGASAYGVIAASEASLRAGPGGAFPESSVRVAPGDEVRVLERRDGWLRVRGEGGSDGWLAPESVALP